MKKSIALLLIFCFIISPFFVSSQAHASGLYTVYGTVYDRHGNPIPNADVKLINGYYDELGTQKTDGNGNFRFEKISSSSYNFKVLITYNDNGKIYRTTNNDAPFDNGYSGFLQIDRRWTTLHSYPPPEYGYLWGTVVAEGGGDIRLGGAAIYVSFNEQKYYTFSAPVSGTYEMMLPVGHYNVYAQYQDSNGYIYQSRPVAVDVIGATVRGESNPLQINIPRAAPASNPEPAQIPGTFVNTVNGTVTYKDGKGIPGAKVSLWQSTDDSIGYSLKAETFTDSNGLYTFNDVKVTSNDGKEIYGMKTFRVSATFTDSQGNDHVQNKSFPLYHPNIILGIGGNEQSARNMTADLQFDYSTKGWIKIETEPQGAKIFVDGQPLTGPDGKQLTTPCTAYIDPGTYRLRLSLSGYSDREYYPVEIAENVETDTINTRLDKSMVPAWVIPAVAVLIILIVVGLILAVVASKRHTFMKPLSGVLDPITRSVDNFRSSSAAKKAQRDSRKASAAEAKTAEKARQAGVADPSLAGTPKIDRRREPESFRATAEQPMLPEHASDDLSMVSAREIYRKGESSGIERISYAQATGSAAKAPFGGHDMPPREPAPRESPVTEAPDGRIRVPRAMPAARDEPAGSLRDKERVIRYVREHGDGVSFIQMSNELDIPPNKLTIITKELVINDDIEKVKGLYFYKTHDTSPDEGKSSVVVWRLDGED